VGIRRNGAQRSRFAESAYDDSTVARGVLEGLETPRLERTVQPGVGAGRAGGGLYGICRIVLRRRVAPEGVVRRAFSRGQPNGRRRGVARRRELFLRLGLGVQRGGSQTGTPQGA